MNGKTAVGKASLVLAAGLFVSTASAEMMARLQRFAQRDPTSRFPSTRYVPRESVNGYQYERMATLHRLDWDGRTSYSCTPSPVPPGPNPNCTTPPPCKPSPCDPDVGGDPSPTCDGRGNCVANIPGGETVPWAVTYCWIMHECDHCRMSGPNACCGKFSGCPVKSPCQLQDLPCLLENAQRECGGYSTELQCYENADCAGDQRCENWKTWSRCTAICRRNQYCSPCEDYLNPSKAIECLGRCGQEPQ
jgi:hypothetical protein